jgi:hypothetical protein
MPQAQYAAARQSMNAAHSSKSQPVRCKAREIKMNENRRAGGGGLRVFSGNRAGPVAFFLGIFAFGILCISREIAGGINEHFCHLFAPLTNKAAKNTGLPQKNSFF